MSWMGEVQILIMEARGAFGITLDLSDFGREGDQLTIDGMPVDQWFAAQGLE